MNLKNKIISLIILTTFICSFFSFNIMTKASEESFEPTLSISKNDSVNLSWVNKPLSSKEVFNYNFTNSTPITYFSYHGGADGQQSIINYDSTHSNVLKILNNQNKGNSNCNIGNIESSNVSNFCFPDRLRNKFYDKQKLLVSMDVLTNGGSTTFGLSVNGGREKKLTPSGIYVTKNTSSYPLSETPTKLQVKFKSDTILLDKSVDLGVPGIDDNYSMDDYSKLPGMNLGDFHFESKSDGWVYGYYDVNCIPINISEGKELNYRFWRDPSKLKYGTFNTNGNWQNFNYLVDLDTKDMEFFDIYDNGLYINGYSSVNGASAMIDNVKVSIANKFRIYRNGSFLDETWDSNYNDKTAKDKDNPTLDNLSKEFTHSNGNTSVNVSFNANDIGTLYTYKVALLDLSNTSEISNNTNSITITSGIKNIRYKVSDSIENKNMDGYSTTISNNITLNNLSTTDKFLFLQAEDNEGNLSEIKAISITENSPEITVKNNNIEWATEILEGNVLWSSDYSNSNQSEINLNYWNAGNGCQYFTNYEGFTCLATPGTIGKGNWINNNSTIANADLNHAYYTSTQTIPKNTYMSISYRVNTNSNLGIHFFTDWIYGNSFINYPNKVIENYPSNTTTMKLDTVVGLKVGDYITFDSNPSSQIQNTNIAAIDKTNNTITLVSPSSEAITKNTQIKHRPQRFMIDVPTYTTEKTNGWKLVNQNFLSSNDSDVDFTNIPCTLRQGWKSTGTSYLADLRIGYATKVNLMRNGKIIYTGYDSSFIDNTSKDINKPSINLITINIKNDRSLQVNYNTQDFGSIYNYQVQTIDKSNNLGLASDIKSNTITSGLKQIRYKITTDPNENINSNYATTTDLSTVNIKTSSNAIHYILLQAEDNEGNLSNVIKSSIDLKSPEVELSNNNIITNDFTNIDVNIIDDSNTSLLLPDGNTTSDKNYSYKVTENGEYEFVIKDSNGNTTTKTIEITNIDKEAPKINIIKNTEAATSKNLLLNVKASDNKEIEKIVCPDGSIKNDNEFEYEVTDNGDYLFSVFDTAGNITTKTITVTNIDKSEPSLTITNPIAYLTNKNIKLKVKASDNEKIEKIVCSDGSIKNDNEFEYEVSENGEYTFTAYDNAVNKTIKSITVSNIDKEAPILSVENSNTNITKNNIKLKIKATDNEGIEKIVCSDGSIKNDNEFEFEVAENGKYKFVAYDNAGNITEKIITVSNIDKIVPLFSSVSLSNRESTYDPVFITIEASDNEKIAKIEAPEGVEEIENTKDKYVGKIKKNGTYTFKITDTAGNETEKTIEVTNILGEKIIVNEAIQTSDNIDFKIYLALLIISGVVFLTYLLYLIKKIKNEN